MADRRSAFIVLALVMALGGCREEGEVYDRSLDETRLVLRQTEVPLHFFGPSAPTAFSVSQPDPATTVWKVTSDGSPVLTYTARAERVDDHRTRVTLTMAGASSSQFGDTAARLDRIPAIRDLYIATMTEATDSALEARPFDPVRFYPQITAATASVMLTMKPPPDGEGRGR